MSSTMPCGYRSVRSANCKTTLVLFKLVMPKEVKNALGITLMATTKSNNALVMVIMPIVQGTVKDPGVLEFDREVWLKESRHTWIQLNSLIRPKLSFISAQVF